MNLFKDLYKKYFGETKYHIRILTVDGGINTAVCDTLDEVDKVVKEINTDHKYDMITRIEKIKTIPFKYNKEIIHKKLHFRHEIYTEMDMDGDLEYSYPKIQNNLTNVVRRKDYGN
jgi:predicted sulfurtransferase